MTMSLPAALAVLVALVGSAALRSPSDLPARRATILLSPVTTAADREHRLTGPATSQAKDGLRRVK
jgi:hypothetical protein